MDKRGLYQKLRRIEALHAGATTPGERVAAERARERLLARIHANHADLSVIYLQEILRDPDDEVVVLDFEHGEPVPSAEEIIALLVAWAAGDRSSYDVWEWASWYVDKALLPEHPADDPRSIPVEVILQLSSMERQPLTIDDVPALLAFLRSVDETETAWQAWFAYVGAIDWDLRTRRRRKRRA